MVDRVGKSEAEWKAQLTPEQFKVARKKGTERAFTGEYWNDHAKDTYSFVWCNTPLFPSENKYESGTGRPSFWKPVAPENVRGEDDISFWARRTEVVSPPAPRIWVMSSRTAPSKPASATASTPPHSCSSRSPDQAIRMALRIGAMGPNISA